jgi:hypothetical protein
MTYEIFLIHADLFLIFRENEEGIIDCESLLIREVECRPILHDTPLSTRSYLISSEMHSDFMSENRVDLLSPYLCERGDHNTR